MNDSIQDRQRLIEAAQSRVARHIVACLGEQVEHIPQDISERLRVARAQAVQRARVSHRATAAAVAQAVHRPSPAIASAGAPPSRWWPVISVVPLMLLLLGLAYIQRYHERAQIHAAAEVDAALLSDNLPPAAYRDPGFIEFLKRSEP